MFCLLNDFYVLFNYLIKIVCIFVIVFKYYLNWHEMRQERSKYVYVYAWNKTQNFQDENNVQYIIRWSHIGVNNKAYLMPKQSNKQNWH